MVPVSAIIAFLLLGIEEIGVQIEEPFGILPLGADHATVAIHSCIYAFLRSPVHSCIHSFMHSLTRSFTHSSVHPFIGHMSLLRVRYVQS